MGWGTFLAAKAISYIGKPARKKSRYLRDIEVSGFLILARGLLRSFASLDNWNEKWWGARGQKWQWLNPYQIKWLNPEGDIEKDAAELDTSFKSAGESTAPPLNTQTLESKIEELRGMREKGVISQEEFVEARRNALGL